MSKNDCRKDLWGVFHIELVNGCPNNCEACASQSGMYFMDAETMEWSIQQMETFKNKFENTRLAIKLFGTGESVLHPNLGKFALQLRQRLDPDFVTLSTNIKTLQKFRPSLPSNVAFTIATRLEDVFNQEIVNEYGEHRLGILVPDASDTTVDRLVEVNSIWPTPSIQLVRMFDMEIPSKGRDFFIRRDLPFSDIFPFKDELIAKLTNRGIWVTDEFSPGFWNIRTTLRYNKVIDACLMMKAPITFDFSSDDFYNQYFYARKKMCTKCPRYNGFFTLSMHSSKAKALVRMDMLKSKNLQVKIVDGR